MATVIETLFVFLETHSGKTVFFQGSTPTRTRLYRIAIGRLIDELFVEGIIRDRAEPFQKNTNYTAYLIRLN